MIGVTNYYRNCDSHRILNYISYILQYSCAKTLARRKKKSLKSIFIQYGKNLTIKKDIKTLKGEKPIRVEFPTYVDLKRKGRLNINKRSDTYLFDPFKLTTFWRTKFKFYGECCICGSTEDIQMHHINSLQKIKKNKDKFAFIRSATNRLQIPVCLDCHKKITNGTYNSMNPIKYYNEFIAKL